MTTTGTVRMALLILLLLLPAMCGFAKEQTDDDDDVDVIYDHIAVDELSFNFSRGQDAMYIYVDDTLELNITINSELAPGIIVFQSSNERVFVVDDSEAFGLSHLFALDDSAAVGLIVDGSCPGGWLSNAFTVLLDLDFVLSLTMTFCSTFIALGMMPLNLFLYTRKFTADNDQLTIPYLELAIQLCMLIIPVGIGILIVTKFPKFKLICDKILKPVATGLVAIGLAVTLPFDYYCFLAGINIYAAAITLPLIGGILGLALAKLACLTNRAAITVAIETGSQNALLALTMVKLFYPLPEADLVSRIPLLVVIFYLNGRNHNHMFIFIL
ncbi:putative ileal sodium/bile acid cotransporter [Apostichopus japonicus]|uniref:Putative ileal sodium/bile acid cotransporter n=1 Tax=Stichopus japonicus TaxID=307972 RepID=A0A2G8JF76_STIJA|nr:putative ileal sodium/bile acid cotransporter [Apostichopus japonicus]